MRVVKLNMEMEMKSKNTNWTLMNFEDLFFFLGVTLIGHLTIIIQIILTDPKTVCYMMLWAVNTAEMLWYLCIY